MAKTRNAKFLTNQTLEVQSLKNIDSIIFDRYKKSAISNAFLLSVIRKFSVFFDVFGFDCKTLVLCLLGCIDFKHGLGLVWDALNAGLIVALKSIRTRGWGILNEGHISTKKRPRRSVYRYE